MQRAPTAQVNLIPVTSGTAIVNALDYHCGNAWGPSPETGRPRELPALLLGPLPDHSQVHEQREDEKDEGKARQRAA